MERNILQYKCYTHQQEVIAFDLDPLAETKDKCLCLKCLAVQSPYRQIETIQDAQQKFMEMKILEFKDKEKQLTSNLEKLFNIQKQIKEFLDQFTKNITESQILLNLIIQKEYNELKSLSKQQYEIKTEKDLLDLINYINYGQIVYNNEINQNQLELINKVQQSLNQQIFDENLQNISNSLESIYSQSLNQVQKIQGLQVDYHKFQNLRYLCETHQSNIMMISLEAGQIEQRLFCQICIQEKKLDGLNSLFEVNEKWQTYLQNIYISNNRFHNERLKNQFKINELISKYQKFHQEFFKGLSQLLIDQNKKIIKEANESQLINLNKQLYQMELEEIKQIIQTLLQQDQMQEVLRKQLQVQKEDKQNYDQIFEQFNQLKTKLLEIIYFQKIDFKFSDKLKHRFIHSSHNKKIARAKDFSNYAVILCEQPIPQNGQFSIDFKINEMSQIMIGVCKSNSIKKDFIFNNYGKNGHGFYCLSQDKYVYSHHDSTKNNKQLGINFQQNDDDIINVEVNQQTKQIIWRNKAKGLQYELEFEPSEDLYFCCVFYRLWYQKEFYFEVEII